MTLIELSLMAALALHNSPYRRESSPVWTSIRARRYVSDAIFFEGLVATRLSPKSVLTLNPIRAQWGIEAGTKFLGAEWSIGHVSDHGVERLDPMAESVTYAKVKVLEAWK